MNLHKMGKQNLFPSSHPSWNHKCFGWVQCELIKDRPLTQTIDCSLKSWTLSIALKKLVSSAYCRHFTLRSTISLNRSRRIITNRRGPQWDPWGTEFWMVNACNTVFPAILRSHFLLMIKFIIVLYSWNGTASEANIAARMWWSTWSKAWEKSK